MYTVLIATILQAVLHSSSIRHSIHTILQAVLHMASNTYTYYSTSCTALASNTTIISMLCVDHCALFVYSHQTIFWPCRFLFFLYFSLLFFAGSCPLWTAATLRKWEKCWRSSNHLLLMDSLLRRSSINVTQLCVQKTQFKKHYLVNNLCPPPPPPS